MKRLLGLLFATACFSGPALGDDKDATPILDKAIVALGGEAKLAKAAVTSWKASGTITFNENEAPIKTRSIIEGFERQKSDFEFEINGNSVVGVTVFDGAKGWRKIGDMVQDLDGEALAVTRQNTYLQAIHVSILPLKTKPFEAEAAPDEKVGDKMTAVVKAKGPDGKPFTLYFDKQTGLLLKLTATIKNFQGEDVKEDSTFSDYKEFDGIKRATKVDILWDGKPFLKSEYSDFKTMEKAEPGTFAEPK